ncbi:MAG: SRPBCC domain-containing protein [Anaerolineaceae bacterium]|nr:SRPBCC domain-containing protein [Anaerolineaceae bacterium]
MEHNIKIERLLPYSHEQVWQAITDQKILSSWFMPNDFVPKLHQEFQFQMKPQRGWDGLTHCEVIELEPGKRIAFTYRGEATGEKALACANVHSRSADKVGKNIFTQLDTVLSFTLTPEYTCGGVEQTQLVMEHTGFKGLKLMVISLIMGYGWRKVLKRLSMVLEAQTKDAAVPVTSGLVQEQ